MAATWDLGSRTTSEGNSRSTTRTLCSGIDCEPGLCFAAEPPNDVSPQVEHVVGPLAKRLVFERLELLIPPLENAADGRFRGQRRSSEFALEFARIDQAPQHRAMRAKDACQRRIEFRLDPLGRLFQLGKGFLEGVRAGVRIRGPTASAPIVCGTPSIAARLRPPRPGPFPSPAQCSVRSAGLPAARSSAIVRVCPSIDSSLRRFHARIESKRWAQVTASEPSPTAKPTRLVEPERMSPAASTPGRVVSRGQGSRSARGHSPERTTSVPVSR